MGPGAGAGNLETTASEDVYAFTTAAAGAVQIDVSSCASSLGSVAWKLVDADSGAVKAESTTCSSSVVSNLPAKRYKLRVSRLNRIGTYGLRLATT